MYYVPESLKSEGMLAVEIIKNDRQQVFALPAPYPTRCHP